MRTAATILFLVSCAAFASALPEDSLRRRSRLLPDFIPVQFAGNIGFVSAGIGYSSKTERYNFALHYGYVPSSLAVTPVHLLSVRNTFPLYRFRFSLTGKPVMFPYAGIGISAEVGGISYLKVPERYPKGYYITKGIHANTYVGMMSRVPFRSHTVIKRMDVYAEAGTIDAYVWYAVNSRQIKLNQVVSIAVGMNLRL